MTQPAAAPAAPAVEVFGPSALPLLKGLGGVPGKTAGGGGKGMGYPSSRRGVPNTYDFLEMGSPRLALARALGVPFAPWLINLSATFTTAGPAVIPDVSSDTKIIQDVYVEAVVGRVLSQVTIENQFDTLSGFFGNAQNPFELKLFVQGAPRYDVIPKYTMLSTAIDTLSAASEFHDWVLTYDQNLEMSIQTTYALPVDQLPIKVQITFRTRGPIGEAFSRMTNEEALERLKCEFGIEACDAYNRWHCR